MRITPLSFLSRAERFLESTLPDPATWRFQRFINLGARSGSLEIMSTREGEDEARIIGTLHARMVGNRRESFVQGWLQVEGTPERLTFMISDEGTAQPAPEIEETGRHWVAVLTQRAHPRAPKSGNAEPAAVGTVPAPSTG